MMYFTTQSIKLIVVSGTVIEEINECHIKRNITCVMRSSTLALVTKR